MRDTMRMSVLSLGLAGMALGQPEPRAHTPTPLLTGPSVEPAASAPTLVRLGYEGRIERVADAQPEVAALDLVDLDDHTRARVAARLDERARLIDAAVVEHYETLLDLYTAFGSGDQTEVIRLYLDFTAHLQPIFEGGGLGRQLGSEMPLATRREYGRLLMEYYAAVSGDILEHPQDQQGNAVANRGEALRNYKIQLLMEEVGRSFSRIIEQKVDEFQELLTALRLTPEREGQVRAMVERIARDVGLNPTQAQQREIFMRLMEMLEPEERQRLLAHVLK